MTSLISRLKLAVPAVILCAGCIVLSQSVFAQESAPNDASSRDRYKPDLAGNPEVEKVIRAFEGKGEVGDNSEPTPADVAVKQFQLDDGLKIELVSAEPVVEQPLYISFDPRGRLWVVQYRQYPFPAGLKVIRYDQYLRAVFDNVPKPPPHHVRGKDKITVFEDTDGDGQYDSHKDVITGLNITSSVVTDAGGIWVLNPPYLLFYPDANGDDIPDADPEVKLTGFGLQDTHSVANSLKWGPDGWLYGANGSTTTATISSRVSKNVAYEGQCIWRFHPRTDVFEVYAEGGGNTFSLEIDSDGRVFSGTNHGNTRGMYYPQGSYGEKNWGKHGPLTNPYAFGFFHHMKHDGDTDRFPQTFVIYEGGMLPQRYFGNVIAANSLHNRVWASELSRDGSTYQTVDMPVVCETDDRWFRPVDVKVGPDGAVYLADWYDTRLTHVDPRDNWHKTSGRLYRIRAADAAPAAPVDMYGLDDQALIARFDHPNKWHRQTAVKVLGERLFAARDEQQTSETRKRLRALALSDNASALEAVWTINLAGDFDEALARKLLNHADPDVRRWSVRLLGDQRKISRETGEELAEMASAESYVQVRSQLASSARRFETQYALPILKALLTHVEDQTDPHMPLMLWWAFESHCGTDLVQASQQIGVPLPTADDAPSPREQVLKFFSDAGLWQNPIVRDALLSRLMRRFAMANEPNLADSEISGPEACAKLLEVAPADEDRQLLMSGFLEAYQGREISQLPEGLRKAISEYQQSLGKSDLVLGLRLGEADAIKRSLARIRDEGAPAPARLALIETLGQVEVPQAVPVLLSLLRSPSSGIQKAALMALMRYSDPAIGRQICTAYQRTLTDTHGLREVAQRVLASRADWTSQLLAEIEEYRIRANSIAPEIIQQMRLHPDPALQARIDHIWGKTRATAEEKIEQIAAIRQLLVNAQKPDSQLSPDPAAGHALFKQHCATCHTLFSEGGNAGPNLTGYERTNLDFLLLAIVDPSAAIREEFTQFQIATIDGRVLTGLITQQTPTTVTLRGAKNETTVIPRGDIDILQAMSTSLMPDGLLQKLSEKQVLDLFSYLMQPTPTSSE